MGNSEGAEVAESTAFYRVKTWPLCVFRASALIHQKISLVTDALRPKLPNLRPSLPELRFTNFL
jgi:hypothetical protein